MKTNINKVREDQITFTFEANERPVLELPNYGKPYLAAVTSIYVRVDAETGEVLSISPSGKKLKKNGELSTVNAYFSAWKVNPTIEKIALKLLKGAGY